MGIRNTSVGAGTPTSIYQADGENAVTTIIFCNTGVVDTYLTVWMVPASGSLNNSMMILNSVYMPAGETFCMDTERFILADGDAIFAEANDTNLIASTVSFVATH
jgi:hypothetical protein